MFYSAIMLGYFYVKNDYEIQRAICTEHFTECETEFKNAVFI